MKYITVCCVCHRVKSENNTWIFDSYNPNTVSHGYCEECAAEMMKKIEARGPILKGE